MYAELLVPLPPFISSHCRQRNRHATVHTVVSFGDRDDSAGLDHRTRTGAALSMLCPFSAGHMKGILNRSSPRAFFTHSRIRLILDTSYEHLTLSWKSFSWWDSLLAKNPGSLQHGPGTFIITIPLVSDLSVPGDYRTLGGRWQLLFFFRCLPIFLQKC